MSSSKWTTSCIVSCWYHTISLEKRFSRVYWEFYESGKLSCAPPGANSLPASCLSAKVFPVAAVTELWLFSVIKLNLLKYTLVFTTWFHYIIFNSFFCKKLEFWIACFSYKFYSNFNLIVSWILFVVNFFNVFITIVL